MRKPVPFTRAFRTGLGGALDWVVPVLAAISLLIACIVLSGKKPLWYDEVLTRTLLTDPSTLHMLRAMASGAEAAPPLYHLIARGWIQLFGSDPLSLRMISWAGLSIAVFVTWRTLRRTYDASLAAIGLLVVFCTSTTLLQQTAEVRFYGLLMALVALCILATVTTMRTARPSRTTLALLALVNAGLVLCHFFGFLYSGALLAAQIAWDLRYRRLRPAVYASVAVGWLAYVPWIGPTISQASMGKPSNWTPIPGVSDLLSAFSFQIAFLPIVVLVLLFLVIAGDLQGPRVDHPPSAPAEPDRLALSFVAYALLALVPLVFVFSRVAVSLFLERYLLPAALAWAILVPELFTRMTPRIGAGAGRSRLTQVGSVALGLILLLFPVYVAVSTHPRPRPGSEIEAMTFAGAPATSYPIAVESNLLFLPMVHYSTVRPVPYYFVLDWDVAIAPGSELGVPMENKAMQVFRRNGYVSSQIVEGSAFLCDHSRFVVVDGERHRWAEMRVRTDSNLVVTPIGAFSGIHDRYTVLGVERRGEPAGCRESGSGVGRAVSAAPSP